MSEETTLMSKFSCMTDSARQLERELSAALKAKEEADTRIKVLEEWAEGPNGVKWYIARLEEAERDVRILSALLTEWREAELDYMDEEYQQWIDSFTARVSAAIDAQKDEK
jgi:hypothetical protein